MEGSDGSPPLSLGEIVRAAELFPKAAIEKEDDNLVVPYTELPGEAIIYLGRTDDGILTISNYRLFLLKSSTNSETSVPLGSIEVAQVRDLFHLVISCKDANTVKCSFITTESCVEWQRRISLSVGVPDKLESLFAFPFYAWTSETLNTDVELSFRLRKNHNSDKDFRREVKRLHFDLGKTWRISDVNKDFKLCPSYPRYLLVPNSISDETLQNVASFRSSRRIPVAVWRHKKSGAVIARCSQPEVGWLGWRNSKDEQLLQALADSCDMIENSLTEQKFSNICDIVSSSSSSNNNCNSASNENKDGGSFIEPKKILIVDARSYTSAVTNRARGGGCECPEYYPSAEIQFMNLGNIHAIRKSFQSLRQLCASPPDIPNWLSLLERTVWLQHISGLLAASMVVCHTIEKKSRPVLVHCSDGWDRTPQIVATAQLCLDPFYRTVDGFRVLIEREWLSFGHKFADRCGHGPESDETNERCPVFLQWLDCVHQIHRQFPCSFEFNMAYLIKLTQHSNSCLFGTFLCNTVKERSENTVNERTFSVWPFLSGPMYKNPLYVPNRENVLWPAHNVRDLVLWGEVYMGSFGNQCLDGPATASGENGQQDLLSFMTKTRSYGDLSSGAELQGEMTRRSSDPSMIMESHILTPLHNSSENSIDSSSERISSSPLPIGGLMTVNPHNHISDENSIQQESIVNLMRDTTKKLENLTNELNQSDEEFDSNEHKLFINNNLNNLKISPITQDNTEEDEDINNSVENYDRYLENRKDGGVLHFSEDLVIKYEIDPDKNNYVEQSEIIRDKEKDSDIVDGRGFNGSEFMLQSIDLRDTSLSNSPIKSQPSSGDQNLWYGSVETSTDTLVPIEKQEHNKINGHKFNGDQSVDEEIKIINSASHYERLGLMNNSRSPKSRTVSASSSQMEESIVIQPEYEKLEINGGKLDRRKFSPTSNGRSYSPSVTTSRFSTPGDRSLPLTPPGQVIDRPTVTISCPDGLAHAISEENLRLQQIVYENKLREEALQRELYASRLELLKKPCQQCNAQGYVNNEEPEEFENMSETELNAEVATIISNNFRSISHSLILPSNYLIERRTSSLASIYDSNVENASVCSWEAVDDGNGIASSITCSQHNDLWVPDHAVSQCTGCNMVFWLGRRKHHCRSCGQIFCADCSEYRAILPDKRLYTTVRLCAACYNNQTSTITNNSTSIIQERNNTSSICSIRAGDSNQIVANKDQPLFSNKPSTDLTNLYSLTINTTDNLSAYQNMPPTSSSSSSNLAENGDTVKGTNIN